MEPAKQTLRVFSIFYSIQGESTYQGLPCIFVRLAGCPLRCSYCDTRVACDSPGTEMAIDEVQRRIKEFSGKLVEVTGGEPLSQAATAALLRELCDDGYEVLLETSGAVSIAPVDPRVTVIMDIKTPGSGMADRFLLQNLDALTRERHQVKFVVTSRGDFDFAVETIRKYQLSDRVELLISPVAGTAAAEVAEWVLDCGLPVRLQLQLHRVLWSSGDEAGDNGRER